jgi:hypothetical protein
MMAERECPGIKSSAWTKLKLSILCGPSVVAGVDEHRGDSAIDA